MPLVWWTGKAKNNAACHILSKIAAIR